MRYNKSKKITLKSFFTASSAIANANHLSWLLVPSRLKRTTANK
jgi:hypothetical protein